MQNGHHDVEGDRQGVLGEYQAASTSGKTTQGKRHRSILFESASSMLFEVASSMY